MGFDFQRGETNTVLLSVLRLSGTVPAFPADYNNPKLRIIHINGNGEIEDLAFTNMTQVNGSNNWFLKFPIAIDAPFKKFLAIFETIIEGVTTQSTEEFRVVAPMASGIPGTGEFSVTLIIKQEVTLLPIGNAVVRVFDKATPTVPIAQTETDANGSATVFLDTGSYLVEFSKSGVISEIHDLVVSADGSHKVSGN